MDESCFRAATAGACDGVLTLIYSNYARCALTDRLDAKKAFITTDIQNRKSSQRLHAIFTWNIIEPQGSKFASGVRITNAIKSLIGAAPCGAGKRNPSVFAKRLDYHVARIFNDALSYKPKTVISLVSDCAYHIASMQCAFAGGNLFLADTSPDANRRSRSVWIGDPT